MREIVQITSRENAQLKEARRVRDGKQRDRIFIEGVRLVDEAIRSQIPIDRLFVSSHGFERNPELKAASGAGEIYVLPDRVFDSISDTANSQGVVAIVERPSATRAAIEKRLASGMLPVVTFLYQISNPSNLGAVIRTAEAAGTAGVIVSTNSADAYSPKSVRASMGSSFRLPVWTDVELSDAIQWALTKGLRTVATETDGATSHTDVDWTQRRMVVFGSEAHGLPPAGLKNVDDRIFISMESSVESLNLAVACGVILFEARRQITSRQRSG